MARVKSEVDFTLVLLHLAMFFYGTLCHPPILERVVGVAIERSRFEEATLHHFSRKAVVGDDYPALVAQPGSSVKGIYVRGDFTVRQRLLLDKFEGNESCDPFVLFNDSSKLTLCV